MEHSRTHGSNQAVGSLIVDDGIVVNRTQQLMRMMGKKKIQK
jgi:hypothetical protein